MKLRKLTGAAVAAAMVAFASGALAYDKTYGEDGDNWLEHLPEATQGPLKSPGLVGRLGSAAPESAAGRVVRLDSGTTHVNVQRGETVKFVYGDKAFAWRFDTGGGVWFDLGQIAPRNFGTGHVRVNVLLDPSEYAY